jgi:hypothetical protein
MTEEQIIKAKVALRRIQSDKDIKQYKLQEYYECRRLALLLRLPFSIIKKHYSVGMAVNSIGLVSFHLSDVVPISRFLQRSDAPTFEKWLEINCPEEYERYKADTFGFLFGKFGTDLTHTDTAQKLIDEFDKYTWFKNEQERRYYFSGLLQAADIEAMDEFDLYGVVNAHSDSEMQDFKAELAEMQADYKKNPSTFFNPSCDAPAAAAESVMDVE